MPRLKKAVGFEPIAEVESLPTATLEPPPPPPPLKVLRDEPPPLPPCALDGETVNSKVVVIRNTDGKRRPILMTPRGESVLSQNDVAWSLPENAKVSKEAENRFVAVQLDHNRSVPALVCSTAREAIALFHSHFHG